MKEDRSLTTSCPRCGYDLRGTVESWRDSCPLDGVCNECGLEFPWAEIVVPDKFEPRWCIEFEPARKRLIFAAWTTFLRSFLPWRFWHEIQMSQRIRWGRLGFYMITPILALVLLYVVWQSCIALHVRSLVQRDILQFQQNVTARIGLNQKEVVRLQGVLPEQMQRFTDVERARAQLQSMIQQNQAEIARLQTALNMPPRVEHSTFIAMLEAVFLPLADESAGVIVYPSGSSIFGTSAPATTPYPAPSQLYDAIASNTGIIRNPISGVRWFPRTGRFEGLVGFLTWSWLWQAIGLGVFILFPLTLIALPVSLGRAGVQWSHIARVFVYSTFIPVLMLVVAALFACFAMAFGFGSGRILLAGLVVQKYAPMLMLIVWWGVAIQMYLRVPRAWLIAPLHAMLSLLLILGGIYVIDPEFMFQISRAVFPSWML